MNYRTAFPSLGSLEILERLIHLGWSDESRAGDQQPCVVSPDKTVRLWVAAHPDTPSYRYYFVEEGQIDPSKPDYSGDTPGREAKGLKTLYDGDDENMARMTACVHGGTRDRVEIRLAHTFADVLRSWLSAVEMAECSTLALANPNEQSCPSHNYCDANMAMDEAFRTVMGRGCYMPSDWEEGGVCTEAQSDADVGLWNEAWTIAKAAGFYPVSSEAKLQVGTLVEDLHCNGFPEGRTLTEAERASIIDYTLRFEECTSTREEFVAMTDKDLVQASYWVMAEYASGQV